MKNVLVVGAGKSSPLLIDFLLQEAVSAGWTITVGDLSREEVEARLKGHECGRAVFFDVNDIPLRERCIKEADIVISMLPARYHPLIVKDCIRFGKHFVSASYVSDDIRALDLAAKEAGVIILKEIGLDPGIDHMSAMERLDELRAKGVDIREFETFTGGLVAPEHENNPWRYKFSWNPRNVVLSGQGVVKFKHNGLFKYIPYHRLFQRYELLEVPGYGLFEGYPNRDSLKYREAYRLDDVDTIYRGTLRRPGFCKAWDALVQLGLTDDSFELEGLSEMSWRDFTNAFLWYDPGQSVELKLSVYLKLDFNSEIIDRLAWLGLFSEEKIGMESGTPAQVLQKLLEDKWRLEPGDRDMIVMLHRFTYLEEGVLKKQQSSMVVTGDDSVHTAMAKTVGLPVGIAAKLILEGGITDKGVIIPTSASVYRPVMGTLKKHGIVFTEQATPEVSVIRSV